MPKPTREKFKTFEDVFDRFTLRNVFNLGEFFDWETMSPISIGKEANVFSAEGSAGKVAVKIYRLETCDFNRMYDYIKSDPRYISLKKKRREVVFAWCQREYRNLFAAREASVKAPIPIKFLKNILVMEFIGEEAAAPKLKDLPPENVRRFFEKTIKNIKNFYRNGYVHGDLSKFNILNFREFPVFIDFSQATTLKNPNAEEWLRRDIKNVCNFFAKLGIKADHEKVLKEIRLC
jgi:RIO kinase 1